MNSNLVISTGYTQSIIETLLCKKKLLIINNSNNSNNFNLFNDYKYFLNDFKKIHCFFQNFVRKSSLMKLT